MVLGVAVFVAVYLIGRKVLIQYLGHRLNGLVIELYEHIPTMTQERVNQTNVILDNANGVANPRYLQTARLLIELRQQMLNKGK